MELLTKYFPQLTPRQLEQYEMLGSLYPEWNEKINVISRKDIDNLYPNHILHSLAIARFLEDYPSPYSIRNAVFTSSTVSAKK